MTISSKSIAGFVSDMIATWQAQTGLSIPFSSGDPLLAFWQSVATQLDFLQAQIAIVLSLARASTSTGADLDSWMAQFQFFRLQAVPGTGQETFSINAVAGSNILIPAGTVVQTVGGAIQYEVVGDTSDPSWNPSANSYVLPVGSLFVTATVQANIPGTGSNVVANVLTQFGTSLPGIASCTNPEPITNGVGAESDDAFRARFILYLATLAKATKSAILAAAQSVQQGLLIALLENQQPNGTPLLGSFTVIVDDGSGSPPASLINSVFEAVDQVRAFSVEPFVVAPTQLFVSITLAINIGPLPLPVGTSNATINTAVQNAVAGLINELPPGGRLNGSSIISAALSVPFVAAVNPSSVTINGGTADLIPAIQQEIRVTVAAISVSNY